MLFMKSYLCYCSVRLGVLIVAALAIMLSLTLSTLLFVRGVRLFDELIDLLENDSQYKSSNIIRRLINWIEQSPDNVLIFLQIMCYAHIAAAILGMVGALRLHKWLLLPLALFELIYFLGITISHIVMMIMLKKQINLGLLIVLTLVGSFYCLFAGYNCVTCLAMYQIINLVRSSKYRQLYGEDPFQPIPLRRAQGEIQQLRLLHTPEDTDIDEQKRLAKLGLWPVRRQPQVISVIPVQAVPAVSMKWWQQQALDKDEQQLQDSAVYRNWQRDELLRGVGGDVERKNAINRRYAAEQHFHWR
ncbi:uncharacterized protein LOC115759311 [Drosophila novamexicana]|uniref:uncharacterized protein LOC115759311 n=1 Tax=Drosophila novamexicana TaxID=47314 RepID=UPI0011E6082C|nr:uncharacterized protein LOC115759311 [Drosophila novamexicana]